MSALRLTLTALALALAPGLAPAADLALNDFIQYWAAGTLCLRGENPYDPGRMADLERQAGRDDDFLMMWNPPWALPFVLSLGLLPPRTGRLLWLVANA